MYNVDVNIYSVLMGHAPKQTNWNTGLLVPYAYDVHPEDPQCIVLNEHIAMCLRKALEYIEKGASYKDAAIWLSSATKKPLVRQTLFYMHKKYLAEKKAERERKRMDTHTKNKIERMLRNARRATSSASAKA